MGGTFSTVLYNTNSENEAIVYHQEFIPSFLRPKLETLRVMIGEYKLNESELRSVTKAFSSLLRGHLASLEFNLTLPKNGTRVLISYSFSKAFLYFDEFPPNPNRGFDVPSALTTYVRKALSGSKTPGILLRSKSGSVRLAMEAILVTLPYPDFSMPYNVITLSSTGFALFFGMLVNISVRRRGDKWAPKRGRFCSRKKE